MLRIDVFGVAVDRSVLQIDVFGVVLDRSVLRIDVFGVVEKGLKSPDLELLSLKLVSTHFISSEIPLLHAD